MKLGKNTLPFILLVSISLLACIVAFASLHGKFSVTNILQNFVRNLPVCLLIAYIDYKIIVYSHKWHTSFSTWTVLSDILVSNILVGVLSVAYIHLGAYLSGTEILFSQRIILSSFCNTLFMLIAEIFFYNRQYLENKAQLAIMEKEKAQYQFEALKNQINPHFLFNSLNVLSSLAFQDAAKANLFAKELSSVYRYLLTTQELMKVPLQDELDFVKSYSYLEQIRFGESLRINLTYNEQALSKSIVPASIQMLVENALKHNINTRKSPLVIDIRISEENVTVTNNLQLRSSVSKNHKGLDNLEKQYRIHGKHIGVMKSDFMFTVVLPLL